MSQARIAIHKEELWKLLVDTAHALPMYKNHKRYVQEVMLKERPEISAQELSVQINIPLGEAIVMLDEIRGTNVTQVQADSALGKSPNRTLLDFEK